MSCCATRRGGTRTCSWIGVSVWSLTNFNTPREDWHALALGGGYSTPAYELDGQDQRRDWFAGYATACLERDLRQLSAIENLADMRRVMAALCLRLGGLMN